MIIGEGILGKVPRSARLWTIWQSVPADALSGTPMGDRAAMDSSRFWIVCAVQAVRLGITRAGTCTFDGASSMHDARMSRGGSASPNPGSPLPPQTVDSWIDDVPHTPL